MQRTVELQDVNSYLICGLCKGYLIDAATLVECLHSFCRSCIVRYVSASFCCPVCHLEIHKTKPLENIRSDPALQEIVYKLVPDLFAKETSARKAFELGANVDHGHMELGSEDDDDSRIRVTLKYFRGTSRLEKLKSERVLQMFPTRYLCCPQEMPVQILKKFVLYKFDLCSELWTLDIWRGDETLCDSLTMRQLVRIYGCFRDRKPLELHFSLLPRLEKKLKLESEIMLQVNSKREADLKDPILLDSRAFKEGSKNSVAA